MHNEFIFVHESLLKFKNVILICIKNTGYKKDLNIYIRDLTFLEEWIIELNKNKNTATIKDKILDIKTAKILSDYWRQGICGELHNEAYLKLISEIKSLSL